MKNLKSIKCLLTIVTLSSFLGINAQTTQTFKVINIDNGSVPIAGVSVKCSGGETAISDKDGICTIHYKTKKPGDRIALENVQKEGYSCLGYDYESTGKITPDKVWNLYISVTKEHNERVNKTFNAILKKTHSDYSIGLSEYTDSLKYRPQWYQSYLSYMDFNILNVTNRIRNISNNVLINYHCDNGEISNTSFKYLLEGDLDQCVKTFEDADLLNKIEKENDPEKKKELLRAVILYLNCVDIYNTYPKLNELKPYYETLISNNFAKDYAIRNYIYYLSSINQMDSAINLTKSSIKENTDQRIITRLNNILASIYFNQNNLKKSEKTYKEVIDSYIKLNISDNDFYQDLLSDAYVSLSNLYRSTNNINKAIEYRKLALEAFNKTVLTDSIIYFANKADIHKDLAELYSQLEQLDNQRQEDKNYYNCINEAYKLSPEAFNIEYILSKKQLLLHDVDDKKFDFDGLNNIVKAEKALASEYPLFFNSRVCRTRLNILYGIDEKVKAQIDKKETPDLSELKSTIDSFENDFSILNTKEPIVYNHYYFAFSDLKISYCAYSEDSSYFTQTMNNVISLCQENIIFDSLYYLKNLATYSYRYGNYLSNFQNISETEKYYAISIDALKLMLAKGYNEYKAGFGEANNKLANAYFKQDKDELALNTYQETINWYNTIEKNYKAEAESDYLNALYSTGYTQRHIKQFDKAIDNYNKVLKILSSKAKKNAEKFYNVANIQVELALCNYGIENQKKAKDLLIEAVNNYSKVIKGFTNENYLKALNYLKQIAEETKDWNLYEQTYIKKVEILKDFTRLDTNNYIVPYVKEYLELAKLHNNMNKYDLSEKEHTEVVDIYRFINKFEPKEFRRGLIVALYYQGCNLMDKEIYNEAINSFTEANSLNNVLMLEDSVNNIDLKEAIANKAGLAYYYDRNDEEDLESLRNAKDAFKESLRIREYMYAEQGDEMLDELGYTNRVIGDLNRELELFISSEESYLAAKKYYEKLFTTKKGEGEVPYFRTIYALGDLYQANLDRAKEAEKLYRESLEVYNNMDNQNKLEVQKAYYYLLNDLITVIQESKLDSSDLETLMKLRDSTKKELEKKS